MFNDVNRMYCIVLYCILFAFHESTITIKWDIEQVKSNTSNSVINYFHFSVQKYVYINGQLIALFIIFFNISHIVFHI